MKSKLNILKQLHHISFNMAPKMDNVNQLVKLKKVRNKNKLIKYSWNLQSFTKSHTIHKRPIFCLNTKTLPISRMRKKSTQVKEKYKVKLFNSLSLFLLYSWLINHKKREGKLFVWTLHEVQQSKGSEVMHKKVSIEKFNAEEIRKFSTSICCVFIFEVIDALNKYI